LRKQPIVTTLGCVNTIFIVGPYECIFNGVVEPKVDVVDNFGNIMRKKSVKMLGVGINGC